MPEEVELSPMEKKIIEHRTTGLSFCQISGDDLKHKIDQLILRASAIVGCPLPNTEFFADIMTDEIITFVREFGYSELTISEILFALRVNAKGGLKYPTGADVEQIPFSGNYFNVDYFSKVLSNYFIIRRIFDRKLENYLDGYK